ncbi:MAG: hypothetical protein ACRCT8_15460 [Lacipirellulaceae bacterium]
MGSSSLDSLLSAMDAAASVNSALRGTGATASEIPPEVLDSILLASNPRKESASVRLTPNVVIERIARCPGCCEEMDLPAPRAGEPTETWRCLRCGATCLSGPTGGPRFDPAAHAERATDPLAIPSRGLPTQDLSALRRVVSLIAAVSHLHNERRTAPRYPVSLPALGAPLDRDGRVIPPMLKLTLRDVSIEGLSFFAFVPVSCERMVIDLTPGGLPGAQVVVALTRLRQLGFLYEVGGTFVVNE